MDGGPESALRAPSKVVVLPETTRHVQQRASHGSLDESSSEAKRWTRYECVCAPGPRVGSASIFARDVTAGSATAAVSVGRWLASSVYGGPNAPAAVARGSSGPSRSTARVSQSCSPSTVERDGTGYRKLDCARQGVAGRAGTRQLVAVGYVGPGARRALAPLKNRSRPSGVSRANGSSRLSPK
jgi:hypothetical protein